jgi:glycosyltransferase involved in cell wall biosynthesis
LLLHLHNVESHLLARRDGMGRSWPEWLLRNLEANGIRRAEAQAAATARLVVTVTEADRRRILGLAAGAAVEVVENAVDLAKLPLLEPPADSQPLLLFVGSFDYPPNREAVMVLLRDHLPCLRQQHPELRVRLVGRDRGGEIAALARRHGAEALGHVEDLRPHYLAATAIYAPIQSGGGSRLKILEAFALGRPVVTTRIGIEGLHAEAGRHYLLAENAAEAAAAVASLRNGANGLIRAARHLVETRHSWVQARARLAELVEARFGTR